MDVKDWNTKLTEMNLPPLGNSCKPEVSKDYIINDLSGWYKFIPIDFFNDSILGFKMNLTDNKSYEHIYENPNFLVFYSVNENIPIDKLREVYSELISN